MKRLKRVFIIALVLSLLPAAAGRAFSDVAEEDWFFPCVEEMAALGALSGYPDGSFRPNNAVSKAELVCLAARLRGLSPASGRSGHWADGYMAAALAAGWYDWDEAPPDGGSFDEPITRQLAVKIVMKAFLPEARGDYNTESKKIADFAELDGRYYDSVLAAYAAGVAGGDDKGRFNPKATLTRAEACALISRAAGGRSFEPAPPETEEPVAVRGGVSENGRLRVEGPRLVNERGEAVVLRGMSSHGLQWYSRFLTREAIASTAERGANLLRVAMYIEEGGYIDNPSVKNDLIKAVDTAIGLDMYVIIDWHILSDGDPMKRLGEAKAFFAEMAARYKDSPAVLYEICNEPNGNITWEGNVRPYAEEVIAAIRAEAPEAVIIVGSPTWSQDLHEAAKSPLAEKNIMYSCHFYAGTHTEWLRRRVADVMDKGLAVFVTEWGVSDASGGGGVFADEARLWLDFMDKNGISWANWSLCDKAETSAALRTGADPSDGISDDELSESGAIVFAAF